MSHSLGFPPAGGPCRVIQGFFPGGKPKILQAAPAASAPVQPRTPSAPAPIVPARPANGALQPSLRPGQPPRPVLPSSSLQPRVPQPAAPVRPQVPQPILPKHAAPATLQPQAGNAFALPANFTLKPRGSGQPLPEAIQKKMESFFNTSFADVRVHVGHEAASIGALAFTHGADLYFAPGQYSPQTPQGQQLLGHELTHVVQQRAGRVKNPLGSGVAVVQDVALEAEAERMGMQAASASAPIQAKPEVPPPVSRRPAGSPIVPRFVGPVQSRRPGVSSQSLILPGRVAEMSPIQPRSSGTSGPSGVEVSPPAKVGENRYRIVAGAGGQPIGSVMVHVRSQSEIEVTDLKVDSSIRGRGVGAELIASAASAGQQLGRSRVVLASQDNGSGRLTSWYRRIGFEQAGVNALGCPRMVASIGRVLASVAQARMKPPVAAAGTPGGQALGGPIVPELSGIFRHGSNGSIQPARPASLPGTVRPFRNPRKMIPGTPALSYGRAIQRMEQIKGLPGFYEGALPEANQAGTHNTVWSQTNTAGNSPMSHSSVSLTQKARKLLTQYAGIDHLANEENTHAEDRLAALVHQLAILTFNETGSIPPTIEIPWFFVSASPCTSVGGTSTKGGFGCTENLINWYQNGLLIHESEECGQLRVRVKIGELNVNHLYGSNSYKGAEASLAALKRLKGAGAVDKWTIGHAPRLKGDWPLSSET
jgi:hypothetical protein